MAYITDTTHSFTSNVASAMNTVTTSFAALFSNISSASSRGQFLQELQAMDDTTLMATHGISRGDIVGYVFRDKLVP
ncbi:MAG TPA: hypothetical protein DCF96_04455 [Rhodobacteraceae bacterium]|jgi:hypothetical protein|nr:hypothetical protein [Amylibacter sp.]MDG1235581.1 hypothetical protein [Amylibacter sp.]MDG1997628.1 hypothetical protein [Amylibacter sp.]HAD27899.1 hypothetical protein [Paracoccaceae bacterium]|tara:strand:- start:1097 stop:1327 length:231 start_codon:yes stop_codon:yes gene_type:complete